MKVVHLDEIEPSFAAGVNWMPLRATLGVRAFGINAYSAAAGELVVEEHTETGEDDEGHEEVYVVLAGHATFTVDGDEVDAPAGTVVFLDDPRAKRSARAVEAGTTVLAVGGPVGEPYAVRAWEYAFRADRAVKQGRLDEGRAIAREGIEAYPDKATGYYALACVEAVAGNRDEAFAALDAAVARSEAARQWAASDDDLASLRGDPRFPA